MKDSKTGLIENAIDIKDLLFVKDLLIRTNPEPILQPWSKTWASNLNSDTHPLLMKKLNVLEKHFEPMKFCIINYTECVDAFGIHFDDYQTWKWGEPYVSILLPISQNEDLRTFVFDLSVQKHQGNKETNLRVKDYIKEFPEGESCFEPGMEHLDPGILKKIKLLKSLPWKKNSALYWDSFLCHAGCNIKSKEFIIIHTVKKQ